MNTLVWLWGQLWDNTETPNEETWQLWEGVCRNTSDHNRETVWETVLPR